MGVYAIFGYPSCEPRLTRSAKRFSPTSRCVNPSPRRQRFVIMRNYVSTGPRAFTGQNPIAPMFYRFGSRLPMSRGVPCEARCGFDCGFIRESPASISSLIALAAKAWIISIVTPFTGPARLVAG